MHVDVAVVGAGPAGTAMAMHLARRGYRVALLDRATFPRDKVCGDALSPAALPLLDDLGVGPAVRAAGFPYHGSRLIAPDGTACISRYPKLPGQPDYGISLCRLTFDHLLVKQAEALAPIRLLQGVEAKQLLWAGDTCLGVATTEGDIQATVTVLADGRFSRLHPGLHRRARPPEQRRRAFLGLFDQVQGLDDLIEVTVRSARIQTIVSPQGGERASLCLLLSGAEASPLGADPLHGLLQGLRQDERLAARLTQARPLTPLKAMVLDPYTADAAPKDGLLAIGDAVGFFDPLTGEGMYRALRSAKLASDVLASLLPVGDVSRTSLRRYASTLWREFRWTYRFVQAMVSMSRWPQAANVGIRELAHRPDLAARLAGYQGALLPADSFFVDVAGLLAGTLLRRLTLSDRASHPFMAASPPPRQPPR